MAAIDWSGQLSQYLHMATPDASAAGAFAVIGAGCQAAVERSIGRTFDVKTYTEAYDGNGRRMLFLRHDPVVAITSVSINGEAALSIVDPAAPAYPAKVAAVEPTGQGILLTDGSVFSTGTQNVIVSYRAGLTATEEATPPADLVFAVTYWAGMIFKDRDRLGMSSITTGQQTTAYTRIVPPAILSMISAWRRTLIPPC